MGYLHIDNLYKNQRILMMKECYALEKIHGTSAHISWNNGKLGFFSGGENHSRFVELFDHSVLHEKFIELFGKTTKVVVYGEAYGGKQQGMSASYGKELKFAAFDVLVGELWLSVPNAASVVEKLGLEFVAYEQVPTTLDALNYERDRDSRQAIRNGVGPGIKQEGVVLRPLEELTLNNGSRLIAKHKREEFMETKTFREVSPEKAAILSEATSIAEEWITPMRLQHVLDKLPKDIDMKETPQVISAMVKDVLREAEGEIVVSKEATRAIGARTAQLFKKHFQDKLTD